ncbi:unnamed protein product [Lactuca virosa]|uniref:Uncharacterized protein n=1 Tax=Lactuca virosa TaxID=75947 RepID=A0AAU9LHL0_9ASTR|nr:unnamed protein product [Lactuca virosa]
MQTEVGYRSWRSSSADGGIASRKGCVGDLFSFLVRSVSTHEGGERTSVLCLCLLEKRNLVGSSHKGGSVVLVDRCFFFSGELCQQGNSWVFVSCVLDWERMQMCVDASLLLASSHQTISPEQSVSPASMVVSTVLVVFQVNFDQIRKELPEINWRQGGEPVRAAAPSSSVNCADRACLGSRVASTGHGGDWVGLSSKIEGRREVGWRWQQLRFMLEGVDRWKRSTAAAGGGPTETRQLRRVVVVDRKESTDG